MGPPTCTANEIASLPVKDALRAAPGPVDILTIDYEDWFHILDPAWSDPSCWSGLPSHVERDTLTLLDLLDASGSTATFFVVGWLAERTPDVVREIARRGHALASHGYLHVQPELMSEAEFRHDLRRSLEVLESVAGCRVLGFRAPGFAIKRCRFAYQRVLQQYGLLYDASPFPGIFPGRGELGRHRWPRPVNGGVSGFWEIPISTIQVLGIPVAFSGGGFLRFLPTRIVQWSSARLRRNGQPTIYYLHPRDLNPRTPRITSRGWRRWRYYGGRGGMHRKLETILDDGRFVSVEQFLTGKQARSCTHASSEYSTSR